MTADLGRRTARGVLWSIFSTGSGRALSVVSLSVLARLLAPAEFGLFAFAILFLTYLDTIGDLGTGMALIHWPGKREEAAQVTYVVSVGMAILLFLSAQLLAPIVANFFQTPSGTPILRVLAASLLIKGLGNTHDALCRKDLRFKARIVPELGLTGLKAAVAIPLAWAGFGVWSLVWGQLVGVTVWTLALWRIVDWRPRWSWPAGTARSMFAYGRGIVSLNVLAGIVHHIDAVVVGRWLGTAALGFYQIAYRIPEMVLVLLVRQVSIVLFPALSSAHASGLSVRATYLAALRYTSLLALPAGAVLVVLAGPLVRVVFGPDWTPAVPILQALAVYVTLRSIGTHAGDVLKATGRPGLLAGLALAKAGVLIPVLVTAAPHGSVAVAVALAAVTALTALLDLGVVHRLEAIGGREGLETLRPAALAAACVGLACAGWMHVAPGFSPTATLLGGLATAAVAYGIALRVVEPEVPARALALIRRRGTAGFDVPAPITVEP